MSEPLLHDTNERQINREGKIKAEMDEQTKELIAIGASIGAHCQPYLRYHVGKAKELGIDADLVCDAIHVGQMVEKGAMSAMRDFIKCGQDTLNPDGSPYCTGKTKSGKSCCG